MQHPNPYRRPASDLSTGPASPGGSIEAALAGESYWETGQVMGEAWRILSGFKGAYWAGLLVYFLVSFAVSLAFALIAADDPIMMFLGEWAASFVTMPILAGLYMIAIRHAVDLPVDASQVFVYFDRIVPLFLLFLLLSILITLGLVLLVLPGIYLAVAWFFAVPLMVEKKLGIWEALETSRKAVTRCWFRMFFLLLMLFLITVASMIPLGLGLIWALPWAMLVLGVVYREMFGVDETD